MSQPTVVGICRFSYLGLSDWVPYRTNKSVEAERLEQIARSLYAEARMRARFQSFENICLPSILAQDDPNFIFLIVSSPRMPQQWRDRLEALCRPHHQIRILWTDVPRLGEALADTLRELHEASAGELWQFRLDDDDAIDARFLPRLRGHMQRMTGLPDCAISIARGVNVALYDGQPKRFLEYRRSFVAAGLAVRLSDPARNIFGFGHFAMSERLTHFVDHEAVGALVMKWASDSRDMDLDKLPAGWRQINTRAFGDHIRTSFPFLRGFDFDRLRPAPQDRSAAPAGISGNTC